MQIVFSSLAERDLEEIADYIAADNPPRALTFVIELRERFDVIAAAPLALPDLCSGPESALARTGVT